jgi:hypothetical protein
MFLFWVIRVTGEPALSKKNEDIGGVQQEEGIHCTQATATASVGVAVSDNGVSTNVVQVECSHNLAGFVFFPLLMISLS